MAKDVETAKRLAGLQKHIAEQKRHDLLRCQQMLASVKHEGEAVAITLDGGGLAWQLFPEMSTRFLSNLMAERRLALNEMHIAAKRLMRDSKRLEILDHRLKRAQRKQEEREDDQQRLESLARRDRSSFPQA
jgi:hypothetical protein